MKKTLMVSALLFISISLAYSQPVQKSMNILVYPFQFNGDKQYSWLSAGLTDTVISDLNRIKGISVFSDDDRKKAIKEIELGMTGLFDEKTVKRVGSIIGADVIFTGNIQMMGNKIRVNAKLVNVETTKIENTVKLDGSIDDFFELQDKVVIGLMSVIEKTDIANVKPYKFSEEDKKKIEDTFRPKKEAFEFYAKGLESKDTNPLKALEYFERAVKIQPDYKDALIEAGITAGRELSKFNVAFSYLEKAEAVFRKAGDSSSKDYANLMHKTGSVYLSKDILDKSFEYLSKSKQIREKLGLQNTNDYSALLVEIGWNYFRKNNFNMALENYYLSEKIKKDLRLQNTADYSIVLNVIGSVFYYQGQLERALSYYFQSKEVRDRLNLQDSMEYSNLMSNISNIYYSKGQYQLAVDYVTKAKGIREKRGLQDTIGYGFNLLNLGAIYEKMGRRDLAGQNFRKAYNVFEKVGYTGYEKNQALDAARRLGY